VEPDLVPRLSPSEARFFLALSTTEIMAPFFNSKADKDDDKLSGFSPSFTSNDDVSASCWTDRIADETISCKVEDSSDADNLTIDPSVRRNRRIFPDEDDAPTDMKQNNALQAMNVYESVFMVFVVVKIWRLEFVQLLIDFSFNLMPTFVS
jgi:hypothetical protein